MNKPSSISEAVVASVLLLSFLVACSSTPDPTQMAVAEVELEEFMAREICADAFREFKSTIPYLIARKDHVTRAWRCQQGRLSDVELTQFDAEYSSITAHCSWHSGYVSIFSLDSVTAGEASSRVSTVRWDGSDWMDVSLTRRDGKWMVESMSLIQGMFPEPDCPVKRETPPIDAPTPQPTSTPSP